ncbi:MAG: hypothetical protein HQK59_08895 [Deltaproteobacteria bacterium]|nr:hypothetical protein [Deltaproteobacteria bacterium]
MTEIEELSRVFEEKLLDSSLNRLRQKYDRLLLSYEQAPQVAKEEVLSRLLTPCPDLFNLEVTLRRQLYRNVYIIRALIHQGAPAKEALAVMLDDLLATHEQLGEVIQAIKNIGDDPEVR